MTADEIKIVTKTKQKTRFKLLKSNLSFSIRIKTRPARGNTNRNIGLFTSNNEVVVMII